MNTTDTINQAVAILADSTQTIATQLAARRFLVRVCVTEDPEKAWQLLCPILNQPDQLIRDDVAAAIEIQQLLQHEGAIQALAQGIIVWRDRLDITDLIAEWPPWLVTQAQDALVDGQYRRAVILWFSLSILCPNDATIWPKLAECYRRLEYWDEERLWLEKALAANDQDARIWLQYGHVLHRFHDVVGAQAAHQQAHNLSPDDPEILSALEFTARRATDWPLVADLGSRLQPAGELPFQALFRYEQDAIIQPIISYWAQFFAGQQTGNHLNVPIKNPDPHRIIRLGYLSWDYFNHATMHLLGSLFCCHDRTQFHITILSCGRPKDDDYRRAVEQDADVFVDLYGLGDFALARAIADCDLDILIDLKGMVGRLGHLACRPAPIIASWLGFPGSTGADYVDYLIADHHVISPENRPYYPESIAWMPVCYQLTDDQQPKPTATSRQHWFGGLPEHAVLVGSFCHSIKINADLWSAWLEILTACPMAVIVMMVPTELRMVRDHLMTAATMTGMSEKQLIFVSPIKKADHLNRLAHLDLCLDTWPCGGHTTTTDALWAGVPVLTKQGGHFAGRVAESLLRSVNLPELVADNRTDYIQRAISLINNKAERQRLKNHLRHPEKLPLFQTANRIRDLESLYRLMWQRACNNLPPVDITLNHEKSYR